MYLSFLTDRYAIIVRLIGAQEMGIFDIVKYYNISLVIV